MSILTICAVSSICTIRSILSCRSLCMYTSIGCTYKPVTCSRIYMRSYSILSIGTVCTVGSVLSVLTILTIFYGSDRCTVNIYCSSTSTLRSSYYRTMSILSRSSILTICSIRTILTSRALFSLWTLLTLRAPQSFKLSSCEVFICKRISFRALLALYTLKTF